jgi:SAM-dependent methyltransferase
MNNHYFRKTCRVCKTPDPRKAIPFSATPVGDAYHNNVNKQISSMVFPLDLYLCEKCGLGQLLDVVNPELLYGDFIYETAISVGLSDHFKDYANSVISKFKLDSNSFVFDIGSNDGTLLKHFKNKNIQVLGCEPASEIANRALENGIPNIVDYFTDNVAEEVINSHSIPNVITSNNTFANIDDIESFIGSIKILLRKNNIFIFETGYLLDIIQKGLFDTIYHEHLSYFSVMSLDILFKQNGLELFDIELIHTKGGSLRGFVQLSDGTQNRSSSVAKQIDIENDFKITQMVPYSNLNRQLTTMKNSLSETVRKLKGENKSICGYGASVGVTTFLYYLDIASEIDYLFDDNPAKNNLYSPGNNIQVIDSKRIYDIKPDYIIIFAWRYSDIIIGKHKKFVSDIGKFIKPWPNFEIIGE